MSPNPKLPDVVVAVGTDHHPFDRLVTWIDEWAAARPDLAVLIQRGTSVRPETAAAVDLLPHPELCERFAMAAVVVSHGGPSTVMDARMAGRLPIVVPRDPARGEHVDDHQQRFAEHLRRHGLARVVDDRDELVVALDEAIECPDRFAVPVEASSIGGVVEFARHLDDLLGTSTPLVPATPASADGALVDSGFEEEVA